MNRIALALAPFVAVALAPGVRAQAVLDLGTAVAAASESHPAVRSAKADLDLARAEELGARLFVPENPELALESGSDRLGSGDGEYTRGLSLSQQFFGPGQRRARRDVAAHDVTSATLQLEAARRLAMADAASAYARLAAARAKASVIEDLGALLERVRDTADLEVTAGRISTFERNRIVIESAATRGELAVVQADIAAARGELALAMGVAVAQDVVLASLPEPAAGDQFDNILAADIEARPDVLAARARESAAESRVHLEKRELWPRPRVLVGWERERQVIDGASFTGFPFPADDVRSADTGDTARVEVSFALPLFDRNKSEIAAAIARRVAAQAERERVMQQAVVERDVLVARARVLAEAWSGYAAARAALDENAAVLARAYEAGGMSLTELLLERERLLRGRLAIEDLGAELFGARARLAAFDGSLESLGIPTPQQGVSR